MIELIQDYWLYVLVGQYPNGPLGGLSLTVLLSAAALLLAMPLGLGRMASLRLVLLPQSIRIAVPPLLSQTVNLWKDTSVATVIGAAEMMYQAARVETATFRSVEALTFATLGYLTVSLAISLAAQLYARRFPVRTN